MKVIIDIPSKEFGEDIKDNFQDFFERVKVEIEHRINVDETLLCGNYERETAEILLEAFKNMQVIPKVITNGDMFVAVFKPHKVIVHSAQVQVYLTEQKWQMFGISWWNAPYEVVENE